ncbi:MAG: VWA domain-containing protein [Acidobacteriota bacterium]
MKLGVLLTFLLALVLNVSAQSGRIKQVETPTPKLSAPRPNVKYVPTQERTLPASLPTISPTPKKPDDADEVITVDSTLVPIPVSVVDNSGRAVSTLSLADFELQIDGKTAEISELSRSQTPIRLAMLFDNSSSVLIAREFEKDAAMKFFRRIIRPEKDLAALYSVATVTRLEQGFTSDVSALTRSIEAFPMPIGATALLDGLIDSATYLREVPGRRVIVIVSDGDDTASESTIEAVMKELQIANAQVYVVKTTDFENYKRTGQRAGNANLRQLAAERRMAEIARQTGGAVYSPLDERELDEAFRQISAELSQQYILSYYPENESDKRGQFRNISLTVKGKPNLNVRTRNGYYVPRK